MKPVEKLIQALNELRELRKTDSNIYSSQTYQLISRIQVAHDEIHKAMRQLKIAAMPATMTLEQVVSLSKQLAQNDNTNTRNINICRKCGERMVDREGATICMSCDFDPTQCVNCGKTIHKSYHTDTRRGHMCKECQREIYANCPVCYRSRMLKKNFIQDPNGRLICPRCYEKKVGICIECGEIHFKGEMNKTSLNKYVCNSCMSKHYTSCPKCSYKTKIGTLVKYKGEEMCPACFDKVARLKFNSNIGEKKSKTKTKGTFVDIKDTQIYKYLKNFYSEKEFAMDSVSISILDEELFEFEIDTSSKLAIEVQNMYNHVGARIRDRSGYTLADIARIVQEIYRDYDKKHDDNKERMIGELIQLAYGVVVSDDPKYIEYFKVDREGNKTENKQRVKIGKAIERFIFLLERYKPLIEGEYAIGSFETNFSFLKNAKEALESFTKQMYDVIEKGQAQRGLRVVVSNNLAHKVECVEANRDLRSCQIPSNSTGLAIGLYDMFSNPDLLPALIYKDKSVVGRAMVRRMYDKSGKKYYVLDRLYANGEYGNNKKDLYNQIANKLKEAIKEKGGTLLVPTKSRHDRPVINYIETQTVSLDIKDATIESSLRPINYGYAYYQDSYNDFHREGDMMFDTFKKDYLALVI